MDARDLERGVAFEVGHDRRQAAGEHRLADAGRSDEQQVVAARGRGREREARVGEAAHVDEVEWFVGRRASSASGTGSGGSGHGASPFRHASSSPSVRASRTWMPGTSAASAAFAAGTITHSAPARATRVDERERARDRSHRAVETELAEHADAVEHARRAVRRRRSSSASAIASSEPGAGLAHRRGREVHRDALDRERESRRQQRGAHALARLPPGRVGQPDDRVAGQAAGHVHLDA